MNKSIVAVIFFLFGYATANGQTTVNVVYKFDYVRDLKARDKSVSDTMVLTTDNKTSRYCTYTAYNRHYADIRRKKQESEAAQSGANTATTKGKEIVVMGHLGFRVKNYGAVLNEEIDKDFDGKSLTVYSAIVNKSFKVEEKLPEISWKITGEKETIGGYTCQKAVGKVGGRSYTAWFAPDLPFRDGPWKLGGLPGLILKAVDSKNEVSFDFVRIEKDGNAGDTIAPFMNPGRCLTVKEGAYEKLLKQYATDPMATAQGFNPGAGKIMVVNVDSRDGDNTIYKVQSYNPMTL